MFFFVFNFCSLHVHDVRQALPCQCDPLCTFDCCADRATVCATTVAMTTTVTTTTTTTTTSTTTTAPPVAPELTCLVRGCDAIFGYNKSLSCQCDEQCSASGDCCSDYAAVCLNPSFCAKQPCLRGGTCSDLTEVAACQDHCSQELDACAANSNCRSLDACLDLLASWANDGRNLTAECPSLDACCSLPTGTNARARFVAAGTCILETCSPESRTAYVGYSCACPPGYTGQRCELEIDECAVLEPCGPHAQACTDQLNGYLCSCLPGFAGSQCQTAIGCAADPCGPNAVCANITVAPTPPRQACSAEIQACSAHASCDNSLVCLETVAAPNGCNTTECVLGCAVLSNAEGKAILATAANCMFAAAAVQPYLYFNCSCPAGFTGPTCSTPTNECSPNPCQHGATCVDKHLAFECQCPPGFAGPRCEIRLSCQADNQCQHNATCLNEPSPSCSELCAPALEACLGDEQCSEPSAQACLDLPEANVDCDRSCMLACANSVTAAESRAVYKAAVDCLLDDCLGPNSVRRNFTCQCTSGWTGPLCADSVDDCAAWACLNGGTCVDGHLSASCQCPPTHEGAHCETVRTCADVSCLNGATCQNLVNTTARAACLSQCAAPQCVRPERQLPRLLRPHPALLHLRLVRSHLRPELRPHRLARPAGCHGLRL